jgi:hypothetical protein
MLSISDYMIHLANWQYDVERTCPKPEFISSIVQPWHRDIAPPRAHHYGIENFFRYGPRGIFAQTITKYSRWKRGEEVNDPMVMLLDSIRDAYGYSIILGLTMGIDPRNVNWLGTWLDLTPPPVLFLRLEESIWWGSRDLGDAHMFRAAMTLPFAMWKQTQERTTNGE